MILPSFAGRLALTVMAKSPMLQLSLLMNNPLMHCGLGRALLGKEFVNEVLFFTNRLSEVLIKLVWAIFFIAVMDKAHAVTEVIRILTMHGIALVLKVIDNP